MEQVPILSLEGITKEFPGVKALDSVDFRLLPGEIHALVGENGAGKSTLIKIISGAYGCNKGKIFIEGKEVQINVPQNAINFGISTIYQEFTLVPHLSVAENLFLGKELPKNNFGRIQWSEVYQNAIEFLNRLEVNDVDPHTPVNCLSVAQQRLIEIAKALVSETRILTMDEPTTCLTQNEINILFKVVRVLKNKGISIIYISHYLGEVFEICDSVTVLKDGKKIGDYQVKDVSINDLVTLMIGKDIMKSHKVNQVKKIGDEVLRVERLKSDKMKHPIDLTLRKGEVLGIAGLLGSGRSEVLKAIFGADLTLSGSIFVDGEKKVFRSPHDAILAGIGLVTEDKKRTGLALKLNIKENVTLASLDLIVSKGIINHKEEENKVGHLIKQLNIKPPMPEKRVELLSGGNQQKVVLAKWVCRNCKILLLDEPNKGIDIGAKQEVFDLVRTFVQQGGSVIMVSSELSELTEICNRILIIKEGIFVKELQDETISQKSIFANLVS